MNQIHLPVEVCDILAALNTAGHAAYVVGGCVRDALRGETPHDWDVATSATPEETKACFAGHQLIETGRAHGTVAVITAESPVEITTFRMDGTYSDHRRPDHVAYVTDLHADLRRRDFTINAIAYHPDTGVVDDFGGQADLRAGWIRCVGDPVTRFSEDALRIIRALRFAATLDFRLTPETLRAVEVCRDTLDAISRERIWIELLKMLQGKAVARVLMENADVIFQLMPELAPTFSFPQNNPHHAYDVWTHTVKAVEAAPTDAIARVTMLLHDAGKPACHTVDAAGISHYKGHPIVSAQYAERILERFHVDRATVETILSLIRAHDLRIPAVRRSVRRAMAKLGEDLFSRLISIQRADTWAQNPQFRDENLRQIDEVEALSRSIRTEGDCISLKTLAITGKDLLNMGVQEGKCIGDTLAELLDQVVDGVYPNERDALLAAAYHRIQKTHTQLNYK